MARIPFTLDGKRSPTQQMVDGVKSAIAARHWKPGDTLPTAAEFKDTLGTGGYVPRTALRQLADEGVIILKKHVGAVVAPQKPPVQRLGRVAFISSGRRESYYENVHAFALQDIFEQAGWDLVHIMTPRADDGKADTPVLSTLQRQLRQGIDFAICFTESRAVAAELDKRHVRYIYEGGSGREFPNAIATINLEIESQDCIEQLASFWHQSRIRNVLVVDFDHVMPRNVLAAFAKHGMSLRRLVVNHPRDGNYLRDIQHASLNAVANEFASEKRRSNPPDAVFFYDDYLAAGGLTALAAAGIHIPENMRVATLANKGLGPVWFKPLTRLEYDPVGNARLIGDFVLKLLSGKNAKPPCLTLRFIQGAT